MTLSNTTAKLTVSRFLTNDFQLKDHKHVVPLQFTVWYLYALSGTSIYFSIKGNILVI